MSKEIDHQRKIIQRVRDFGGYGHKWSNNFTTGVPDLILRTRERAYLAEVKLEKNLMPGWRRTLDITPKQKEELWNWREAGGISLILLVEIYRDRSQYISAHVPPGLRAKLIVSGDEECLRFPWGPQTNVCLLLDMFGDLE